MTDETTDPPIEERGYIAGLTVVDIGDYRISRGMTRRPKSGCRHIRVVYDDKERRIWCSDCEHDVEPFDAFVTLAGFIDGVYKNLNKRAKALKEAEAFQVRSIAAQQIDKAWRKRSTVPGCPHCGQGLFPEDFKNGIKTTLGRDYAEAQRNRKKTT
ncbi:MAG: hypothetical protein KAS66_05425 [Candidatus Omnitrophica bacterium]|nr:hypothetical protein [Candidatus Omnitrophota bacterium]